jgi:hypothetical protein
MRHALLLLLVLASSFLSGCSFWTDYVIVNSSGGPVQVTYTIAPTGIDPLAAGVGIPAMLPTSQLDEGEWRKLSATEFGFDRANHADTVLLGEFVFYTSNPQGVEVKLKNLRDAIHGHTIQGMSRPDDKWGSLPTVRLTKPCS